MCEICRIKELAEEVREDLKVAQAKKSQMMTRWSNALKRGDMLAADDMAANVIDYERECMETLKAMAQLSHQTDDLREQFSKIYEAEGEDGLRVHAGVGSRMADDDGEGHESFDDFMRSIGAVEVQIGGDGKLDLQSLLRTMRAGKGRKPS